MSVPGSPRCLSAPGVTRSAETYLSDCSTKLLVSCAMTRSTGAYCESSRANRLCWGLWRCWKWQRLV